MTIGPGGITIFPRYSGSGQYGEPPALDASRRLGTGVPGLDELVGGGLLERSVTLVSGSAGIGKSTLGLQFILEGARHGEPGLVVALEEGPDQIIETAEGIGLPLKAMSKDLVDVMYLSREAFRASQFLTLLDDKIRSQQTRRLVLDSVTQMMRKSELSDDLHEVLYGLAVRFKSLGVTSIFTLEARSLFASDTVTDRGYSPIVDNIVLLRYQQAAGELRPTVAVVKTRGSAHDWGAHFYSIGHGGIRVGERVVAPATGATKS